MEFKLNFKMDNAAFEEDPMDEAKNTLNLIADKLATGFNKGIVFDVNGNSIGNWQIEH